MNIQTIRINKNRGWRGLAEINCYNAEGNKVNTMIFSFSQPVWDDMLAGRIVTQDEDNYIVLTFNNTELLPKGQRSVLLKDFTASVVKVNSYPKYNWAQDALTHGDYNTILHFIKNNNHHTTSDWNCIGVRVIPDI